MHLSMLAPTPPPGGGGASWGFHLIRIQLPHPPGNVRIRGENIMLQNLGIMLFFDAHNMCQLCSANNFIMLQKYAIILGKNSKKHTKIVKQ